jgi:hypothetical protein
MAAAPVSLTELARVFFRIGWLAFGGPVAQLGLIHDECVERRGWLDDEGAMDWLTAGLGVAAFLLLVFARRQVSVVAVVLAGGVLGLIRALLV